MSARDIKGLNESDAGNLFDDPFLILVVKNGIAAIRFLGERIKEIEKAVKSHVQLKPAFEYIQTTPGIGKILGLTVMLEVGDINQFPTVSDYSSYCRCVKSEKLSNNKKKGEGNRKNGIVAIKALSNKLARASYYVMRDKVPYDIGKHFDNQSACGREPVEGLANNHKICNIYPLDTAWNRRFSGAV